MGEHLRVPFRPALVVGLAIVAAFALPQHALARAPARSTLGAAVTAAADRYRVPPALLLSMARVNTHGRMPVGASIDGGWGVMHIVDRPGLDQLRMAARLTGLPRRSIRREERANVLAGAALLRHLAGDRQPSSLGGWRSAVARLGGGAVYADVVLAGAGGAVRAAQRGRAWLRTVRDATTTALVGARYSGAAWIPASSANFQAASRPVSGPITQIVIHATQGSFTSAINWFRNRRAHSSAHYVVRSADGAVAQLVANSDVAWHAGNRKVNAASIGVEHEAFVNDCTWFTTAMYRSSARLVATLAQQHGIPLDRRHIIGHNEVPDPVHPRRRGGASNHTDPGPCWNWRTYMALVRAAAASSAETAAESHIVDNTGIGGGFRGSGWTASRAGGKRYGSDYAWAKPSRSSTAAPAVFTAIIRAPGIYALYTRWPALRAASTSVPITIDTASGPIKVRVNQRLFAGRWVYLGSVPLRRGRHRIRFLRTTTVPGRIAADAVKLERVDRLTQSGLVADRVGWTLSASRLSLTSDGGRTWRNITPAGVQASSIRGVAFSNSRNGAVVSVGASGALTLWGSGDGGHSWSVLSLPTPPDLDVGAPISAIILDAAHLFVGVRLEGPTTGTSASLIATSDGGVTWTTTRLPVPGTLTFTTPLDGWLIGTGAASGLFVTHNGGRTWTAAVLPRPARLAYAGIAPGVPRFSGDRGALAATVLAGARAFSVVYRSSNRGRTWAPGRTIGARMPALGGSAVAAVTAEGSVIARRSDGALVLQNASSAATVLAPPPVPRGASIGRLDFSSTSYGWLTVRSCSAGKQRCTQTLLQFAAGTWLPLTPP
jgi:photosystem II stability/assembly factor-like uncharacterized protein